MGIIDHIREFFGDLWEFIGMCLKAVVFFTVGFIVLGGGLGLVFYGLAYLFGFGVPPLL